MLYNTLRHDVHRSVEQATITEDREELVPGMMPKWK